jgi:solute carrier family 35 protein E3
VTLSEALILAGSNSGSIVFMNLNLNVNSVGFYQLSKLTLVPVIALLSFVLYGKRQSAMTIASLALVCTGAGIATVSGVTVHLRGVVTAVAAVLFTAWSQIWVGQVMARHAGLTSIEVIRQSYAYAIAFVALAVPLVDSFAPMDRWADAARELPQEVWILLAMSCTCAFGINLATAMVIGRFSALTLQVTGHLKTVLMFAAGYFIFAETYGPRVLAGIVLSLAGLGLYSRSK